MQSSAPIIGITGGIGSGKSFVAREFERLGAVVIDADALAHQVLRTPPVLAAVRERWGAEVFDRTGQIDRSRLGQIVFAPTDRGRQELAHLEELTHPPIQKLAAEQLAEFAGRAEAPVVVIDAPLLIEAGWHGFCDRIVYVEAPRTVRLRRAEARGWSQEDFARREARQEPLAVKQGLADVVIDNSGSAESTRTQVERVWQALGRPVPAP